MLFRSRQSVRWDETSRNPSWRSPPLTKTRGGCGERHSALASEGRTSVPVFHGQLLGRESPPETDAKRVANGVRVSRPGSSIRRALRLPTHRRQKTAAVAAQIPGEKKRQEYVRRCVRYLLRAAKPGCRIGGNGRDCLPRHRSRQVSGFVPGAN